MKPFSVALIACLGFVLTTGAEQPKKEAKKKDNAGPVVNGLQLSLSADKTETVISKDGKIEKPVALKLTFTNVSDKAIKFNAFDLGVTGLNGSVKALPDDSIKYDIIAPGRKLLAPKAEDFPEIKASQTWSYDNRLAFPGTITVGRGVFFIYSVVQPGEFRVKFTYNSPKAIDSPLAKDIWTGELVSNELVITVKAANDANEKE